VRNDYGLGIVGVGSLGLNGEMGSGPLDLLINGPDNLGFK